MKEVFFLILKKKKTLQNLKIKEFQLTNKIQDLNFKNSLLGDDLDLDYVESLIRKKFLFGKKNEIIYILKEKENDN